MLTWKGFIAAAGFFLGLGALLGAVAVWPPFGLVAAGVFGFVFMWMAFSDDDDYPI